MIFNWFRFATESALLGLEAQQVIGLRLMQIAGGSAAAPAEAFRMTTEKMIAAAEVFETLAAGGSARRIVRRYRTRVKANRRRLTRTA